MRLGLLHPSRFVALAGVSVPDGGRGASPPRAIYAAMADELLAQLAALSASGHEDADAVWPSESDDDDDGDSLNASFREPAAGSEGDSDE